MFRKDADVMAILAKMETVKWPFRFEALEPLAQSVDTETDGADGNGGDFES